MFLHVIIKHFRRKILRWSTKWKSPLSWIKI